MERKLRDERKMHQPTKPPGGAAELHNRSDCRVPKKLLKEGFRVVSSLLDEVGRNNWWPIRGIQNFQQSGSALELLKSKNLKIKKSTLERFLEECDAVAPWFAVSGSLTVLSWDKLGRDLDFAAEQGTLRAGVRPISKMVRGCLEDQRCSEAIEYGKIALERLEEERSEITVSEKGAARGKSLYPNLEDFEFSEFPQTDSEGDGDSEEEFLAASVRSIRIRPTDHPKTRKQAPQCCVHKPCKQTVTPTALPPYTQGSSSAFSPETWRMIRIRRKQDAVMITRAFTAIEVGQSPQAWLAALKQ
ncbi:hypothetical protein STEG23_025416 [Scotinomys teguina]